MSCNITKYCIHTLRESSKRSNYDSVSLNSDKKYSSSGMIETRQGDTLGTHSGEFYPIKEEMKPKDEPSGARKISNAETETQELTQIEDAITEMLNARGEEYIKIRIDCESQEIKDIDCNPDTMLDQNGQNVERFKKKINEVLTENRAKLVRLKEQLEFGKAKLIQANKSIAALTGIKKSHESVIDEQIKHGDSVLQVSEKLVKKSDDTTIIAEHKTIGYTFADFDKSGCKALQNIQNLLEQKKYVLKGYEQKEMTIKEKFSKVEEDHFYDAESVPSKNF